MELQIPGCVHAQAEAGAIFWQIRRHLARVFRELTKQKDCEVVEAM